MAGIDVTARPEPTTGTRYDSFLAPRSKTPAKDALYGALFNAGWRFDQTTMTWHTPEDDVLQGFGRLEYDPDVSWACIQPPSQMINGHPVRPQPILRLWRAVDTNTWHLEGAN